MNEYFQQQYPFIIPNGLYTKSDHTYRIKYLQLAQEYQTYQLGLDRLIEEKLEENDKKFEVMIEDLNIELKFVRDDLKAQIEKNHLLEQELKENNVMKEQYD